MTTAPMNPQFNGSHGTSERRRNPLANAVRNVGIVLDTAARVLFLGRDGVKM
ncbi:hypothetical protein ACFV4P_30675 [Kitasatospora sp. NPDC059795]|uniref:hypothetical protein n=1 Tax=Kitasatospora sp. NPDC059795 TaxID=3346949 RepID=UPI00365ECB51